MADTLQHQAAAYPLPVYSFKVTVGGETLSFSEVTGLVAERETVTYRHGLSYAEGEALSVPQLTKYVPVTMKRGVVRGRADLYRWYGSAEPRPVDVALGDATGTPVVIWRLTRAVPIKLAIADFNASANEVSVETLEVMAAGISVEYA